MRRGERDRRSGTVTDRVELKDLVRLVAQQVDRDPDEVARIIDATFEELYAAIKRGQSVSVRGFGSFYVRPGSETWVFRFNPSQRLRRLFGWSSTYRGEV
jgi:DNA-binding protein HU-beta